eukprot:scaffold17477_cov66-Phaeocystis_antarctica.AAC.9
MGTCVASMIVPTAHMPFPPPRARGEGAVTSLLRMLGMAATKLKGAKWSGCRDSSHGAARANRGLQAR